MIEDPDCVLVIDEGKTNGTPDQQQHQQHQQRINDLLNQRNILLSSYTDVRNKNHQELQKFIHSLRLLPETSPQRSYYQEKIEILNQHINRNSHIIDKLEKADTLEKLEKFYFDNSSRGHRTSPPKRISPSVVVDDAQLLGLTSSGAVEIRRVYGPPPG